MLRKNVFDLNESFFYAFVNEDDFKIDQSCMQNF